MAGEAERLVVLVLVQVALDENNNDRPPYFTDEDGPQTVDCCDAWTNVGVTAAMRPWSHIWSGPKACCMSSSELSHTEIKQLVCLGARSADQQATMEPSIASTYGCRPGPHLLHRSIRPHAVRATAGSST